MMWTTRWKHWEDAEKIAHINLLKKWNDPQNTLFAATETKVEQSEGSESLSELPGEGDDQGEPLNCNLEERLYPFESEPTEVDALRLPTILTRPRGVNFPR